MKNKKIFLLPLLCLLFSCGAKQEESSVLNIAASGVEVFTMDAKANYYWNVRKSEFKEDETPAKTNQMIYASVTIEAPCKLVPPETNPVREGYDFTGWYTEPSCQTRFDFLNKEATTSIDLYAGWERTGEDEYVEPEYVEPIEIDETIDHQIEVTGVLNTPFTGDTAILTYGGMVRLRKHPTDCRFALNYKKKQGAEIVSAVFDNDAGTITAKTSLNGVEETQVIKIAQTTVDMKLANTNYEWTAYQYEEAGGEVENHHIMLAGSSSIEFWKNYESALDPIVAYNHGIGGTTAIQWRDLLLERLVVPYSPKAIVYYVGVNDIVNNGQTAEDTIKVTKELLEKTHERLPNTHVFYILINVLPGWFAPYEGAIRQTAQAMNEYAKDIDWLTNIDAGRALMKEDGKPDKAYFRLDCIHMSEYGYILWGEKVKEALKEYLG